MNTENLCLPVIKDWKIVCSSDQTTNEVEAFIANRMWFEISFSDPCVVEGEIDGKTKAILLKRIQRVGMMSLEISNQTSQEKPPSLFRVTDYSSPPREFFLLIEN